jgi:hypothetical protein
MLGGVMSFFIIGMLLLVTRNLYNNSITHPPPTLLPIPPYYYCQTIYSPALLEMMRRFLSLYINNSPLTSVVPSTFYDPYNTPSPLHSAAGDVLIHFAPSPYMKKTTPRYNQLQHEK